MDRIVQSQFRKFHDSIRLDIDDNKPLREKRDMLVNEIREFLKKKSEDEGTPLITFQDFNQGSYSMGTGNKPAHEEDDYDIDVGLLFDVSKDKYSPLEVKGWVFAALSSKQFRTVEWKRPCIRVQYTEEGLPRFHVDFAVYSDAASNIDKRTYLAKGKPNLPKDDIKWEVSEPKRLRDLINNKYSESEPAGQFKRTIRYMKRWKDEKFTSVHGKPTGIALTALSYNGFQPYSKSSNGLLDPDDLKANLEFTKYILSQFSWTGRISVKLPVPPYNDLFEKMSDEQCKVFKERIVKLRDTLQDAINDPDPHSACKRLQKEYGKDFPVPPKEETGQTRKKAMAGTSESA